MTNKPTISESIAQQLATAILEVKLAEIASDYQFDAAHPNYLGFLNTEPESEWKQEETMALVYMINNHSLALYDLLAKFGLTVADGPTASETIFVLLQD